jgi:hypothetical protein
MSQRPCTYGGGFDEKGVLDCLAVYLAGLTLILWLRQTGALTEEVWNFDTNTWHPRPSLAGAAVNNLRFILDFVGLATLLLGLCCYG